VMVLQVFLWPALLAIGAGPSILRPSGRWAVQLAKDRARPR